ncbi:valine--tRNA ligase [Candidatus Bathyarchaeota archaeon A05DMB-5]|nr:valine--tRNA ligase [Candidatus Bathyarchaeota archaeon A05DMB-5]
MPKEFDIIKIERKWQEKWEEMGVYRFDWKDTKRPVFSIDTPPPYPSGEFHMGNVLNWTYFDIVARYKRMRGYNVYFPQGWDCHGLGIEVQVEREHKVRKRDVPPDKFRKWCEELVEKYIAMMKEGVIRLGCSVDWTTEYRTMNPDYWRCTQLSFIILYKKGFMYQGTHPVNWCPRCETAIADAEVDYEEREGTLHYIKFPLENSSEYLLIATTRPEFIPACVAVAINPSDDRFNKHIGKKITVPIVNRTVEIIPDENVDPSFGTGVVMICTYGDKEDVKTVIKHKLPVIGLLNENGTINENGGKYAGLTISKAKEAIVKDLQAAGLLEKTERIKQEIGVCDRCDAPVEILERKQWFMKTRILTDKVEEKAKQITWYPDYMKIRLIDWARSLDWDWVISRQRVFGTPIPVWYCKNCNEVILADERWVPIDPKLEKPRIDKCPKCGGKEFIPERDVFDTWMDSSISCAVHAGWPDREDWRRLFPADLHPSGIDIIRTWAYYLMVRHLALFDEEPYKSCLINGMVLGSDGRKMSKSLKNYVAAPDVLDKYGTDAARQWAAGGGATGSDIPFRWPDVEYGKRFLTKLWNAAKFVSSQLEDYKEDEEYELQLLDKWILSKAQKLTQRVTEALEKCQFNIALEEIRNFTWHLFCDQYIEAVKDRLYKPEVYGEKKRKAVQLTLYNVLYRIIQLLAPISPHITEEIYDAIYKEEVGEKSLQLTAWPTPDEKLIDEGSEKKGDLVMAVITEIRREKAEKRKPLNAQIKKLKLYAGKSEFARILSESKEDIKGTCKITYMEILSEKGKGRQIPENLAISFICEY